MNAPEKRKAPVGPGALEGDDDDMQSLRLDDPDRNPAALNFDDEDAGANLVFDPADKAEP